MTAETLRALTDADLAKMADLVRDWQNKVQAEMTVRAMRKVKR